MARFFLGLVISALVFCAPCTSEAQILDKKISDSLLVHYDLNKKDISLEEEVTLLFQISKFETNPKKKIFFAEKALAKAKDLDIGKKEASLKFIIAQSEANLGSLYKALQMLIECSAILMKFGDKTDLAGVYNEIGSVYNFQQNYVLSSSYYLKSYDLYKSLQDSIGIATSLLNIGEAKRLDHLYDSALVCFANSLSIFDELEYEIGIAYALGNIGLVYAAQNKNDSAEYYINQATEILEDLGDRYPIAVYQTYMADIYKDRGDAEMALKYAHNSLQIAEEEGLKEQIRDASLKLSGLYYDGGDYKKAYDYQNQYLAYRDSINNDDVIRKMADLRTEYEISKKQIEVDLLAQRNKTQTVINYGLGTVVLLMATFAFIIYQNSRKRKKLNLLLSEQKEEIAAQRDQLEELLHMKDRFFGIISHDLRSPVNSLQGITQLLGYYVKRNETDQVEEFVSLADKAINNLASLLDNLLSWALSQQGSLPYRPEKFNYYYVAEEVRRIFSNTASSKKIELHMEVSKDIELYADRDGIFALTRNLINNAIKFTREKGTVSLKADKEGAFAKITISDTGIGIQKDKLDDLFVFDKQKSTKGTAGEKGSGLGLALCKDIVELNGGEIYVESIEGKGTEFIILLPAHQETAPGTSLTSQLTVNS